MLKVDDERRGADGTLRPSVLPGLLLCRRANRMAQAAGLKPAAEYLEMYRDGKAGRRRVANAG